MADASQVFAAAIAEHRAGRLQQADQLYQQVLAADRNHVGAWHMRGILAAEVNQNAVAIQSICTALQLEPNNADALSNLGLILEKENRLSEAEECYRRAIALQPGFASAYSKLGIVLSKQGKGPDAVLAFRHAAAVAPQSDSAHYDLGIAAQTFGAIEEAIQVYRRAIELNPNHAGACNNLGALLIGHSQDEEAAALFRRAIALQPVFAEAYANLGALLVSQRKSDEARLMFARTIELRPAYAEGYSSLGNVCKDLGRLDEAIACFRRAIALEPNSPDHHSNLVFALHFSPDCDAAAIYDEHRRWNEQHAAPLARFIQPQRNDPAPDRRLRIGYVSPDFCDHCQSFFTTPLFSNHDHSQYEIFCYSKGTRSDEITARLRSLTDAWRDIVGQSDEQAAEQIRQDKIDVLVDLTMHMTGSSLLLFARKPAPVQFCWLAYPGTTGLTAIDYRLTDPYLDPPEMFDRFYAEKSIRLPHSFWCYDPLTSEPAPNRLPALDNGHITFGCLNNFCKVNSGVLRLWANVMHAVERSRLILMVPEGSPQSRMSTLESFKQLGISADRIFFAPFQPRADYLATYHKIDIGLETVPYNGHTTSLDSFFMGVPVPTLVGRTVVGRAGISLLENLGLRDLIAHSPDEYTAIVRKLAADLPRLSELRTNLRGQMQRSPLMDGPQFARDVEGAYRHVWRQWCARQVA